MYWFAAALLSVLETSESCQVRTRLSQVFKEMHLMDVELWFLQRIVSSQALFFWLQELMQS